MPNRFTIALLASFCLAPFAPQAGAQDGPENKTKELREVERELETVTGRERDLEKAVAELIRETEALSRKLVATASRVQASEAEITAGEQRLENLSAEERELRAELRSRHDQLAQLLAGLQRLEKDPPPPLAVNPTDALAALRGAMLLGSVVPELRAQAGELVLKLSRMAEIRTGIRTEQTDITENLDELDGKRREIAHLLEQKQSLTQTIREELETERKRAKTLAEKAQSLKDLLSKLEEARIAEEEAAREAEIAAKAAEEAEAIERERQRKTQLAKFMKPTVKFSKARGQLYYPAQGTRVREYGAEDALGGKAEGLSISTRELAQVTAPSDGWVAYAGEFRGYGQLLIINAGEGYHVLLAGMEKIAVDVGQFVRAGEPVGTMGTEAVKSAVIDIQAEGSNPILYVEFRKNGNAIDPRPWWAGNDEKVRG